MPLELAHQIGCVPILSMMALRVWAGRSLPRPFWLVAWAFFVSWFADSLSGYLGTWATPYFWIPIQVGLILFALGRGTWTIGLVCLAPISWHLTGPNPDILLNFTGFLLVCGFARGWLALPLFLYFGVGTFAYFLMISQIGGSPEAIRLHLDIYQWCRALSFLAFVGIITPQVIRHRRASQ